MSQTEALLLSIVIEAATAAVLTRHWRGALAAALSTLATLNAAWRAIEVVEEILGYLLAVILVELAVVLVEAVAYRLVVPLRWPRALTISLVANAVSAGFGLVFYTLA